MNAYKKEASRLNEEWKTATPERRLEIEEEVYQLDLDARDHYL